MRKTFLHIGCLMAAAAVLLGAFGAHLLQDHVPADKMEIFETGVRYQFYHALAILVVALLLFFRKTSLAVLSGWFFVWGIFLFSGSLYLLSANDILNLPAALLGPLTPLGGILFVLGWASLLASSYQKNHVGKKKSNE